MAQAAAQPKGKGVQYGGEIVFLFESGLPHRRAEGLATDSIGRGFRHHPCQSNARSKRLELARVAPKATIPAAAGGFCRCAKGACGTTSAGVTSCSCAATGVGCWYDSGRGCGCGDRCANGKRKAGAPASAAQSYRYSERRVKRHAADVTVKAAKLVEEHPRLTTFQALGALREANGRHAPASRLLAQKYPGLAGKGDESGGAAQREAGGRRRKRGKGKGRRTRR